ncbi:hypothetical protein C5Z26_08565 [Lactobacillus sp. CBA3606]|uniref:GNAT family N-acetyltransferase n=1 Tax=Lactobacillus sp. CBA3606 TaxID=2099789 RepID=UPI000CFD51D1|nr:GNAT family N-acetyltransferase [Lactobacillus sp. CBA3606]AVK64162.1 hypothetical protein C5Z26_08565 [Lactobacillus sp. CBA3606]
MITYRYSVAADLPALFAIDQTIWNSQNSPGPILAKDLAAYTQNYPSGSQLVAVQDEQILGMISWNPMPPFMSMRFTWDIGIGILPQAQHQGVGRGLMTKLKAEARRLGIHRLELRVLATNLVARQFYAQLGFQVESVAREAFYLDGHFVDDYGLAYLIDE